MSALIINESHASYDPAGTVIRLPYDPGMTAESVMNDPTVVHELAHYGQNIGTAFGVLQTLVWDELYIATTEILIHASRVTLPLAESPRDESCAEYWERATVARSFIADAVSQPDVSQLREYQALLSEVRAATLPAAFHPSAEPTPFFFRAGEPAGPRFGIRLKDGSEVSFRISGSFVQETHAYAAEFMTRWAQENLGPEDIGDLFLRSDILPHKLLYFVVQRFIAQRTRRADHHYIYDAVLLCHLAAHLALSACAVPSDELGGSSRVISCGPMTFRYADVGDLFLRTMQSALRQLKRPGFGYDHYFDLMKLVLLDLKWPTLNDIIEAVDQTLIRTALTKPRYLFDGVYAQYVAAKLSDSRLYMSQLAHAAAQNRVMDFVAPPFEQIAKGSIQGPLMSGPQRWGVLTTKGGAQGPSPEHVGGMLFSLITRKLWYGSDLTPRLVVDAHPICTF